MTAIGLTYGTAFFIWVMTMEVANRKSWEVFDISKAKNAIYVAIGVVATLILLYFVVSDKSYFDFQRLWLVPFVVPCFYVPYVLFNRKHRERWSDSFKPDRWNALVLLSCIPTAIVNCVVA
jgi:hypothetical protein